MKIVVSGTESRVGLAHWWPERDHRWDHISPVPSFMRHRAYQNKSRYITMVYANLPQGYLSTFAVCCEKDQPTREKGRFIALLRMGRLLKSMGLRMERTV
jgi:hypothetical protein